MKRVALLSVVTAYFLFAMTADVFGQLDTENLLTKMIEALGGAEKLGEINTSVLNGRLTYVSQGFIANYTETHSFPDKILTEETFDDGDTIINGFDGSTAWKYYPLGGGFQVLPETTAESRRLSAIGVEAFLNPQEYGIQYIYQGKDTANGMEYHLLDRVFENGEKRVLWVDPESYLVYKITRSNGEPPNVVVRETRYSDYRETDGIMQAHQKSIYSNGAHIYEYVYNSIIYNTSISPDLFQMKQKCFSKEDLIADTRQLAEIIEDTHPDPYILIGGKIAFHRHLQHILNSIPDTGMTRNEFSSLLRPFIAAIGDGHTEIYSFPTVYQSTPGGIPFKFKVADQSLVVMGIPYERYKDYLGAVLVSVENVSIDVLSDRLRRLRPIENQYHLFWYFTTNYLWYGPYLQELLPEWSDSKQLRASFLMLTGDTVETTFELPMSVSSLTNPATKVDLPQAGKSGIATDVLGSDGKITYLCIDHMQYYRESFEVRNSLGLESITEDDLGKIPSATEQLRTLVKAMKNAKTEALIVDLRRNGGGDAAMCDYIMYFLYGKPAVMETRWNTIMRLSKMRLDSQERLTIDDINKDRRVPFVEGDYNFDEDFSDEMLSKAASMEEGLVLTPTFYKEWKSGSYENYYCPPKVIVLTSPATFSAGFLVALRLHRAGAILVGTPSSQTQNSAAGSINWSLNHTGIYGRVSQGYALNYPLNSSWSRVLQMDYPITLEKLKYYDFDPNAEVLYAIDLLPKIAVQKR